MATRNDALKIIIGLLAFYPSANIPETTIHAYVEALIDIDAEYLAAAAADCKDRLKWFPALAEIREAAVKLKLGSAHVKTALEAWGEVKDAIERCGRYRDPQFSDPITAATVGAMGWAALCNSEVDQEMSWRMRFIEQYNENCRREVEHGRMSPAVRQISERQALVRQKTAQIATSFSMPRRLSAPQTHRLSSNESPASQQPASMPVRARIDATVDGAQ